MEYQQIIFIHSTETYKDFMVVNHLTSLTALISTVLDGETVETVSDFIWGGPPKSLQMVIAAIKLKDCLLLGTKVMTNLDSMVKSRDITLPTKVHLVKAMVLPVVMYGCESWTVGEGS